jgi:uncharacterized protein YkwD
VKKTMKTLVLGLCLLLIGQMTASALAYATASGKSAQTAVVYSPSLADEVVRQVNAERARAGLRVLRVSAELSRAARVRAVEITRKFSHTRPDGSAWRTVSSAAYGENIAVGQRTADKVMAAWMTSSGHRANILRASYGSIGVCAVVSGGVTYWVQLFGK